MSVLMVLIDDEPLLIQDKVDQLRAAVPDSKFCFLVPHAVKPSIAEAFAEAGHDLRSYVPVGGSTPSVEGFVNWCESQLRPMMRLTAAIFCDWKLEISTDVAHWEYSGQSDDLAGMKDLYRRLIALGGLTKWVFLTAHPQDVHLPGFAVYDKNATFSDDDTFAIQTTANVISTNECDIETYLAYLDRHHFVPDNPIEADSLRHFLQQRSDWPLACQACSRWIRPIAFTLGRARGVLPNCVYGQVCELDDSVWERFYHEFLLFLNPDWHILRCLCVKLGKDDLFAIDAGDGSYRFGAIPPQVDINGLTICIDDSLRIDSSRSTRNEMNRAGRHCGSGRYTCCMPSVADLIATVLYENFYKKRTNYDNKCMFVRSELDETRGEYRVVFETFSLYSRTFDGVMKAFDDSRSSAFSYRAHYATAEDPILCKAQCADGASASRFILTMVFPVKSFGADPWQVGEER